MISEGFFVTDCFKVAKSSPRKTSVKRCLLLLVYSTGMISPCFLAVYNQMLYSKIKIVKPIYRHFVTLSSFRPFSQAMLMSKEMCHACANAVIAFQV